MTVIIQDGFEFQNRNNFLRNAWCDCYNCTTHAYNSADKLDTWVAGMRAGEFANRITLRPDCGDPATFDCLNACGLQNDYPNYKLGQVEFFAERFRVVSPFTPQNVFALVTQPGYCQVKYGTLTFALVPGQSKMYFSFFAGYSHPQFSYANPDGYFTRTDPTDGLDGVFVDVNPDQWHEIIIEVRYATDATGYLKCYHRFPQVTSSWTTIFDSAVHRVYGGDANGVTTLHASGPIATRQWGYDVTGANLVDINGKKVSGGADQPVHNVYGTYRDKASNPNNLVVDYNKIAITTTFAEAQSYLDTPSQNPPPPSGAPVPSTGLLDDFNRADGALGTSSSGVAWAGNIGWVISGNRMAPTDPSISRAYLDPNYNADQEFAPTFAVLPANSLAEYVEYQLQHPITTLNFYALRVYGTGLLELYKVVGGAYGSRVATSTVALTAGDKILLRTIQGTVQAWQLTGGVWTPVLSWTDPTPYTNVGKFRIASAGTTVRLDDLIGGSVVYDTTAPTTPTGLNVVQATINSLTMTWVASTDAVGVTAYRIYRDGDPTPVGSVDGATLTFTDTELTPATSYSYTVTAVDAAGNESAHSTADSDTTLSNSEKFIGRNTVGSTQGLVASGDIMVFKATLGEPGTIDRLRNYLKGVGGTPYVFPQNAILDSFTRADSTSLGASWTSEAGFAISGNKLVVDGASSGAAIWNTNFGPSMEGFVKLLTIPAKSKAVNLQINHQNPTLAYYWLNLALTSSSAQKLRIYKRLSGGVDTAIAGPVDVALVANDILGISNINGDLRGWRKSGATVSQLIQATNTELSSAGKIRLQTDDIAMQFDDFGGGTIAPVGSPQVFRPVVYADNGSGLPGALIRVGAEVSVAGDAVAALVELLLSSGVAEQPGDFHIGFWGGPTSNQVAYYYDNVTGAGYTRNVAYSTLGNPPDPFGAGSVMGKLATVFAVYQTTFVGLLGTIGRTTAWPGGGTLGAQARSVAYGTTGKTLGQATRADRYPPGS